jgi:hypothetical protein
MSVGREDLEDGSDGNIAERQRLEFGWFLPTAGDATVLGDVSGQIPPSLELFDRVIVAAEAAGFEYLLVPVNTDCWEAWITAAMMIQRSRQIRMLVAARPGYIAPFLVAKMVATFDQLSSGRISVNLIAGQSEIESTAEGIGPRAVRCTPGAAAAATAPPPVLPGRRLGGGVADQCRTCRRPPLLG